MKNRQQLYKILRNLPKVLLELVLDYAQLQEIGARTLAEGHIVRSAFARCDEIPRCIDGKWLIPTRRVRHWLDKRN